MVLATQFAGPGRGTRDDAMESVATAYRSFVCDNDRPPLDDAMETVPTESTPGTGLDFDSQAVRELIASLPPWLKLRPITDISADARANLKSTILDTWGQTAASHVDVPANAEVSLEDIQAILRGLTYLPPLCKPSEARRLTRELETLFQPTPDATGRVASPSPAHIRSLIKRRDTNQLTQRCFTLLTAITRQPEGSCAPGESDGPPNRVTIRFLSDGVASTIGEPKHVDVKSKAPLPPPSSDGLVRRPRLIWTLDARNPLRIISWRARACIETEPPEDGGGIVLPEALRCDPPYLHEGLTTTVGGDRQAPIGNRVQLITDPDWFDAMAAEKIMLQAGM